MSTGFEEESNSYVCLSDKVVTTDPWGLTRIEFVPRLIIYDEVKARDLNKQAGKEVIEIISTTKLPQSRKR